MHTRAGLESVLLIGSPNSGKTTLFNWLTNSRFRAVNYPGSTVDCLKGMSHVRYGAEVIVIDSPGIYGLDPHSPDEEITVKLLHHDGAMGSIGVVIVCVDLTQIERQLPLALSVRELGWPVVVALTMPDLARDSGIELSVAQISEFLALPVTLVDGRTGEGVAELLDQVRQSGSGAGEKSPTVKELRSWLNQMAKLHRVAGRPQRRTAQIDALLLHPSWGLMAFFAIMVLLFSAVFWVADPMMKFVDQSFSWMGSFLHQALPQGAITDFLADGVVASFGSVMVFAPQIFILFYLLGVMEDSGYLARAATIVDRPLSWLGLSGRSFVPLLSGYACAVPAILASRTIRSPRERWLAVFIIPLLSCSARLPVYALLLAFLFRDRSPWLAGLSLAVIYLGSFFVSGLAAALLNQLLPDAKTSSFLMELPLYRRPQWGVVMQNALTRTRSYVRRAGPVIFTLALLLWFGTNFPKAPEGVSSSQAIHQSYLGQVGQYIEPVFQPMGLDWRVGVGLLSAFAAREVFVSALPLTFDVSTEGSESTIQGGLIDHMSRATFADGSPVFNLASVLGLIVFFMIALQCSSTTAIAGKEMGSWRFAISQLVVLNAVAYMAAIGVVQLIRTLS